MCCPFPAQIIEQYFCFEYLFIKFIIMDIVSNTYLHEAICQEDIMKTKK